MPFKCPYEGCPHEYKVEGACLDKHILICPRRPAGLAKDTKIRAIAVAATEGGVHNNAYSSQHPLFNNSHATQSSSAPPAPPAAASTMSSYLDVHAATMNNSSSSSSPLPPPPPPLLLQREVEEQPQRQEYLENAREECAEKNGFASDSIEHLKSITSQMLARCTAELAEQDRKTDKLKKSLGKFWSKSQVMFRHVPKTQELRQNMDTRIHAARRVFEQENASYS